MCIYCDYCVYHYKSTELVSLYTLDIGLNIIIIISLLCPATKVLKALILPSINKFLSPAKDQHGFRPRHSTRPTPPVKRFCYADDITVWASGPKIPELQSMIHSYLQVVDINLEDNSPYHRSQ